MAEHQPSEADHPPSRAVTASAANTTPEGQEAWAYLYDLWYLAMPGQRLKPGRLVAMTLLGGAPETGITFRLPGIRTDQIQSGRPRSATIFPLASPPQG